ncbi:glycoside hydrolase family 17 protein [Aplosporella prunicola CBS 121167]|uniref:Probable glucan endo-1,3-beta-glucosidase eglC n=1 Tax=Aplosporella prunicola CBS 121167 TaxID=1176127 RepID=A0A6A6BM20_9PEZI|nr:glycoside hydrolase family 17 protein [Aplosporella prunicola CBS 121167]KAF2145169.1 glycoside hydrolase family 17 protein [Aplosporella prunicola CBS 121167]
MKAVAAAASLLGALPLASALAKGFNIAAERPDGSCKSAADWDYNFKQMKALPGSFTDVRVYAASDCNTLELAVPAAKANNVKLLVGVWTQNDDHFSQEKAALERAIAANGVDWISGVSVGSEDLYRGETTADIMAQKIYDVRGMISQDKYGGKNIKVGHVDTYNAYNASSAAVIKAADFIGMDAYPYWQGVTPDQGKATFQEALDTTQGFIDQFHPGAELWITETGWPTAGPSFGNSHASPANAQVFWKDVLCGLSKNYNTWWFTLRDYQNAPASQAFGVLDQNFQPIFDLNC